MTLDRFWQWVDDRDIDKHVVSIAIMYGTVSISRWAMAYATAHGTDANTALTIAAVSAPYMALQAAAIQQYFKARSTPQ